MIVCIAEKPSVARDIAEVLGAHTRKEGYIEGNGYQVTWTFGHLCTLKEPHEYTPNWKSWNLGSLPMIPPRFGIKLIENPTYEKQFHIIEGLMQNADEIINCGDAGQEGELIQRWVMQKAGARCPVKRLWISSLIFVWKTLGIISPVLLSSIRSSRRRTIIKLSGTIPLASPECTPTFRVRTSIVPPSMPLSEEVTQSLS